MEEDESCSTDGGNDGAVFEDLAIDNRCYSAYSRSRLPGLVFCVSTKSIYSYF